MIKNYNINQEPIMIKRALLSVYDKTKVKELALNYRNYEIIDFNENEVVENRISKINQNIRCLVCDSQTIDESNSPLAKDLRLIVRKKVLNNDTDEEIYSYFI